MLEAFLDHGALTFQLLVETLTAIPLLVLSATGHLPVKFPSPHAPASFM
jgi:hypothetical protein